MPEVFEDVACAYLVNRAVLVVRKWENFLTRQTVDVGEPSDFLIASAKIQFHVLNLLHDVGAVTRRGRRIMVRPVSVRNHTHRDVAVRAA